MKLLSYVILTVLLLSLGAPAVGAEGAADPWGEVVAPGIEYKEYQLPDPVIGVHRHYGTDQIRQGTPFVRRI